MCNVETFVTQTIRGGFESKAENGLGRMKILTAVAFFASAITPTFTLAQTTAADYVSQGDTELKTGKPREALDDYNRAIEGDPKFAAAYDARAALECGIWSLGQSGRR